MAFHPRRILGLLLTAATLALSACGGGENAEPMAAKAQVSTFEGHGSWWNPNESGTGFFFEAQGSTGVVTFYAYETNGRPVWYLASGPFAGAADGKFVFSGTLLRYTGGQPGSSAEPKTPASTVVGPVSIVFLRDTAQVQVPGRSYSAEKFYKTGQFTPPSGVQPETGAFWNPAQGGRGYVLEVANGKISGAVFHYADDGEPTWHLITSPLAVGSPWTKGLLMAYSGGQTLSGAHKPHRFDGVAGTFAMMFNEPCVGKLGFPNMPAVTVQRFAFGSLPAGAECRTPKGTPPPVSYINGVQLTLVSPASVGTDTITGARLPSTFTFSVSSGGTTTLKDRGLFFVVEDPDDIFLDPWVAFESSRVTVPIGGQILQRAGRYTGQIRLFGCLHPTCAVQLGGSPFVIPYDFTVVPAPVIGPVEDRGQCPSSMASRMYSPDQPRMVETQNAGFVFVPGPQLKQLRICLAESGQPGFADVPAEVKALVKPEEVTFMRLGTFGQVDQVQSFSLSVLQEGVFDILPGSGPTRLVVYATGHGGKWSRTVVDVGAASGGRYLLNLSAGRMARSQGLMYVSRMKTTETGATWAVTDPF